MKQFSADKNNTKLLGRYLTEKNTLWLTSTCATVEFYFTGSLLEFELCSDGTGNVARYALYEDGQHLFTGNLDSQNKKVVVYDGAQKSVQHKKITFIKITESSQSYIGIKSINTDDNAQIIPAEQKKVQIEFIGDSITCGYGIDSKDENEPFSTMTEDGTGAYSYLAAKALDADYSMVSYSSFGVVSGWTDTDGINDFSLVPRIYENVCFSWNTQMFAEKKWDFSFYKPNIVVFNLGTNDMSWCKNQERCGLFINAYVEFLKKVRNFYPEAYFVLSIGIMEMGDVMSPYVQKTVEEYKKLTGDKKISYLHFSTQTKEEGYGSGFHPSRKTQERCGKVLAAELQKVILQSLN